jgi:predicted permease
MKALRHWLKSCLSWLPWHRRRAREANLERELRDHLELEIEEQRAAGLSPEQAAYAAHRALGNTLKIEEDVRAAWGFQWFETFVQDIRYAFRMLRKSPGFTVVAVLTLALGIGANAAIFSVVESVLLRPLPFKDAARLVGMQEYSPGKADMAGVSFPDYLVWKRQNSVFEETAAYFLISASNDIVLGGPSSTVRARYSTVTNSFFTILGVQPALGHGFSAADEIPGGAKVFLASDALWRDVLGGDSRAIGKTFLLDGENYTLTGVLPPGFDFPKGCGIWVPTSTLGAFGLDDRVSHPFHVLGRLRRGTSLSQAEGQIEIIQDRLAKAYPKTDANWHVRAQPLLDEMIGNVRTSLFVLLGAVGFILLIACTNVVNLMLARASAREREFAIRSALGAGRMRLVRQNLTESLVIICGSMVFAVPIAKWGMALAVFLTSIDLPRMETFRLSGPVLAFMAAIAALATILVGLAPALEASRHDPQGRLRDGQRSGASGPESKRLRDALIVCEVALALLLLCGAGLMLRSFALLNRVNPGFQPEHLLTMTIALPSGEYPRLAQTSAYLDQLLERLRTIPGVQSAAAATTLPLSGESDWDSFRRANSPSFDWANASIADWRGVTADYFRTLGIPLLRGREFTAEDFKNQNALIINEAMAKKFWPGTDPLGQKIFIRDQGNPLEVIGIVADTKGAGLDVEARPEMYTLPRGLWYAFLVLRTNQEPASVIAAARAQVAALDKGVPVYQVATMDQLLSSSVAPQRFDLFLLGLFAALALGLAAVGIYGVLSFSVSQRTHEIGVRLALGAQPRDVLQLVTRQGMKLVLLGVVIGIVASAVVTRFMAALLFGVGLTDPLTFTGAAVLLMLVALAACYIPARRAMKVDPLVALRYE